MLTLNLIQLVILIACAVISAMAWWRIFVKAGEAGWKCLIPIYNFVTMLRIIRRPWWWILLMFVPIVNIVYIYLIYRRLSMMFGQGVGFAIGIIFLPIVFITILGFGDSRYMTAEQETVFHGDNPLSSGVADGAASGTDTAN